jgi:hypothetical protein
MKYHNRDTTSGLRLAANRLASMRSQLSSSEITPDVISEVGGAAADLFMHGTGSGMSRHVQREAEQAARAMVSNADHATEYDGYLVSRESGINIGKATLGAYYER